MTDYLHPSLPFFIAAAISLTAPFTLRRPVQVLAPLASLWMFYVMKSAGHSLNSIRILGYDANTVRMDELSSLFVIVFIIFGFFAHLYCHHVNDRKLDASSNLYIGSAIGAVLSGDLVTLFVFWEMMAVSSCVLIWNKDRTGSPGALFRYFLVHLSGGLLFFSGIIIKIIQGSSLEVAAFPMDLSGTLIFLAFMLNATVFPLHAWLPDAYPEGTASGSVYLSAYTTKVAVYCFARCFIGHPWLIPLGAVTAVYGVVFALMENDMRRLLSYHIVCQIGYMIAGIGIGTSLGVNAGVGHAVGNILFKGLLFMATGALISLTGKYKLSELGGLRKEAKSVLVFFMIGALAISGLPFLNGFVTKSLLLTAASQAHLDWLEFVLMLVTVGTFLSIALKLSYFAFWGQRPYSIQFARPLPLNCYIAMAGVAFFCVVLGIFPGLLFSFLPHDVHTHVYTKAHVLQTLQLLVGAFLGFTWIKSKISIKQYLSLDLDWFYRKGSLLLISWLGLPLRKLQEGLQQGLTRLISSFSGPVNRWESAQRIPALSHPVSMITAGALLVGLCIAWGYIF